MTKPKVLLINPPETLYKQDAQTFFPPLGILYLAGTLLKNGIETQIIDGFYENWKAVNKKIKEYQPDIVGIPCFSNIRAQALKAARMAKKINKNILVIMGGMHVTCMYEQILSNYPFVDICVIGEGENTLLEIVQNKELSSIKGIAFRKGNEIITTEKRENMENIDDIVFPAWHLVNWKKYPRGLASMYLSRGCIGYCNFCSVWRIWKKWRNRSAKNIIDELEILNKKYNITDFLFVDDAFTINKKSVLDLCQEIKNRNLQITFAATTRVDHVDEEILTALKSVGCHTIMYGVESGSSKILKNMNKPINIEVAKRAITLTSQAGIRPVALLIVGYFGETIETINQTVDFLNEVKPAKVGTNVGLTIYPGTVDYFRCKKMGLIDDSFWLSNKECKRYTKENGILKLTTFYMAALRRQKLSKRWVLNYFKHLPYYFRRIILVRYIPESVKIMYHNFKVGFNKMIKSF